MLEVTNLGIAYHDSKRTQVVLDSVDLCCREGEIVAVVGQSGVGKSTLLRMIAGLAKPSKGTVLLHGAPVKSPSVEIGIVFQDYCVFPWLNVEGNIRFGYRRLDEQGRGEDFVSWLLEQLELNDHKEKWPYQLSGGMLQRVAIGRAVAANPSLLLLDEPFGALDLMTRIQMHRLIKKLFVQTKQATLIVTHNIDEAVALADRIYLIAGEPGTTVSNWEVHSPRSCSRFIDLPREQKLIVFEILESMEKLKE